MADLNNSYGQLIRKGEFATMRLLAASDLLLLDRDLLRSSGAPFIIITVDSLDPRSEQLLSVCEKLGINKVGYTCTRDDFKMKSADITSETLLAKQIPFEEFLPLLNFSVDESFEGRLSFMTEADKSSLRAGIPEHARKATNLTFMQEGEYVALCVLLKIEIALLPFGLISWIWSSPHLNAETRNAFQHRLTAFFLRTEIPNFLASIDIQNRSSVQLFERLGFRPTCVFLKL